MVTNGRVLLYLEHSRYISMREAVKGGRKARYDAMMMGKGSYSHLFKHIQSTSTLAPNRYLQDRQSSDKVKRILT
jgi:hypothetical protein